MADGSRLTAHRSWLTLLARIGPLNPHGSAADVPSVLICQNCHLPVTFGGNGWSHLDRAAECPAVVIAWPPPGNADGEEDAA